MTSTRITRIALTTALAIVCLFAFAAHGKAQEATDTNSATDRSRADVNYEVRLHLLVGSNDANANRTPAELQSVVNQLRTSLPFREYALGVTFVNRVRDGGSLEVKGIANSLLTATANANPATFYDFNLNRIRLDTSAQGAEVIQIPNFRFGMRVPVQTGTSPAAGGGNFPVINYEAIGLTTSVSLRENVPAVIGTLTTSRTDQIMVLVAQIKRADAR